MPITVYGDILAKAILPQDIDGGVAKPRTLLVKLLSKNESWDFRRRAKAATAIANEDARYAEYDKLLGEVVVGWENVAEPFSIPAISDHFTLQEILQFLLYVISNSMTLGADDLKKSVSTPPSPSA